MTTTSATTELAVETTPDEAVTRRSWFLALERLALPILLAGIILFFSVLPASAGAFPTSANWNAITANVAVVALIGIASIFPLLCGHFDFSVASAASLASVVAATLMSRFEAPLIVAVLGAVATGVLVGVVNGALVGRLRLSSFVTTLGVGTLVGGIIAWYSEGQAIVTGISTTLTDFGSMMTLGLPRVVYLVLLVAAVSWYVIERTPAGRRLQSIGSNARSARLVGIPVERYAFAAFVTSGGIAGLTGVVLVARQGGSTADDGMSLLFPALAAVFLGATSITPGRFNVIGTLIGVLLVATAVSGLTLAGASSWVSPVFNGAALVVAVLLSTFLARRRGEDGLF